MDNRDSESAAALRRATNVSLPADLVDEAKALGLSLSRACETGLAQAVRAERSRRWAEENRAAMRSWETVLERDGLPLAQFRSF